MEASYHIARKELIASVAEINGAIHNERIVEYHQTTRLKATDDETSWCSSFVNWCIQNSGLVGTQSAAARSWLKWGKSIASPQKGCIVVLKRGNSSWQGHVGFYAGPAENGYIKILGGNQGNQVKISSYKKDKVLGYRSAA
jgi:uncharacterized protein (TIGR02594 family)